jgi:hypothetical protein
MTTASDDQPTSVTTVDDERIWYVAEPDADEEGGVPAEDLFEITATPNDFNILTIYSFIESGAVKIPGFQRNYVWDMRRASKLIESIIIGLPIPQIFLYEKGRNEFLVIDGQQRLMSIYYFIKQRFPRLNQRAAIRRLAGGQGDLPVEVLENDTYFTRFNLQLSQPGEEKRRLDKLNYGTLGDYKTPFELRPIRNVIIKQTNPKNDDSMFEIFYRLNTGGINLRPQEIRASLYHSDFLDALASLNNDKQWRRLLGIEEPDVRMKDIEIILRGLAMLANEKDYRRPMTRFLNHFSKQCQDISNSGLALFSDLFKAFVTKTNSVQHRVFFTRRGQFNITLFEAVFVTSCRAAYSSRDASRVRQMSDEKIRQLQDHPDFIAASLEGSSDPANVRRRLELASEILLSER